MSAKNTKAAEVKTEAVKAEVETVKETVTPEPKKEPEKKSNLVYLGPTITGVIRHSTVFQDGILPAMAQQCVSEFPMMRRLFVTLDEMPDAVKELSKKQSALGAIYEQTSQKYQTRR